VLGHCSARRSLLVGRKRASLLEVAERFIAQGYDALPVS
jgi:hypothetical protein